MRRDAQANPGALCYRRRAFPRPSMTDADSLPTAAPDPERHDERDTMFARMARVPGTAPYEDYYTRRPERKGTDDRLRGLTPLLAPGSRFFDPEIAREADGYFEGIAEIAVDPAEVERWKIRLEAGGDRKAIVHELLRSLGAVAVGCTAVKPEHVYTHKGRLDHDYGQPIDGQPFDGQPFDGQRLDGQPIEHDYDPPIEYDYGVQVAEYNSYEGGLDYDHGDEGYDWEEDGPYDSY